MTTVRAILLASLLAATAGAADFVVIANQSLQTTAVSANDLKQIYLGNKTTIHDRHVEPVTAQAGAAHEHFASQYLGKSPAGLRVYFRNLVFTGKGAMPRSFATAAEMVAYVAVTPGAIGYVSSATDLKGVVVLTIH